jgi:hypothetical protein
MYAQLGQLAQEHRREMLADARRHQLRHQLRHQQGRPAPSAASTMIRRLGAAIVKAGVAMARVPDARRPARPASLGETPAAR